MILVPGVVGVLSPPPRSGSVNVGASRVEQRHAQQLVTRAAVCSANIDSGAFPHTRIWQPQVKQPWKDPHTHPAFSFFFFFFSRYQLETTSFLQLLTAQEAFEIEILRIRKRVR